MKVLLAVAMLAALATSAAAMPSPFEPKAADTAADDDRPKIERVVIGGGVRRR